MRSLIIALILTACTDASLTTHTAQPIEICAALSTCPEVGCPLPPGPFPGTHDGSGLWCEAISLDIPCYCIPGNGGAYSWCMPVPEQIGSVNGAACTTDTQCASGFCRDFRCCDSDCGGGGPLGDTSDCQACSVAHHGQADGTCTTITNTSYVCRLYADPFCDLSERCDGANTACPVDLGRRQGQVCDLATGGVCPANDATGSPHICPL